VGRGGRYQGAKFVFVNLVEEALEAHEADIDRQLAVVRAESRRGLARAVTCAASGVAHLGPRPAPTARLPARAAPAQSRRSAGGVKKGPDPLRCARRAAGGGAQGRWRCSARTS